MGNTNQQSVNLQFLLFNPRSVNNKIDDIMCKLSDYSVDIAGISETWLKENNSPITAVIKSYGYSIIHNHRADQRGGGTALIYKSCYTASQLSVEDKFETFEYTAVNVKSQYNKKITFVIMYRTGPLSRQFMSELDTLLSNISARSDYLVLAGDLNIHFELLNNSKVKTCSDIITSYGLEQQVKSATHIGGGYLDQIFTSSCDNSLSCLVTIDSNIGSNMGSDHYIVLCEITLTLHKKYFKELTYRNLREIDKEDFGNDLTRTLSNSTPPSGDFGKGIELLKTNNKTINLIKR